MKSTFKLSEIARFIDGNLVGDDIEITGISGIIEAKKGDITFLHSKKYLDFANKTEASAIITSEEFNINNKNLIIVDDPYLAFARLLHKFSPDTPLKRTGISERTEISETADIGKNTTIKPFAVISENSEIGDDTIIGEGVYIGDGVKIGKNCVVYPNVSIYRDCEIHNNVIIHSGTVIGSDGFGYAHSKEGVLKMPQIGTVIIEDDVEIGSNVSIDRGTTGTTLIKSGTKIDNLVQIAHNVVIGKNSIIVSQVGISGSTTIGDNVVIAGQVGIVGHIEIGDGVKIGAKSGVSKSIPANEDYFGIPARPIMKTKRIEAFLSRYNSLLERIKTLEKKLSRLEDKK
jgi:UDP-3-O-[3-hydroxymyristoyl] glucosamine N-acyltransferase